VTELPASTLLAVCKRARELQLVIESEWEVELDAVDEKRIRNLYASLERFNNEHSADYP